MNHMNLSRGFLLFCLTGTVAHAQTVEQNAFRFHRRFEVTHPGPHRLAADLELIAHAAPTLADLRLVDANQKELPYLLIPPTREPPQRQKAKVLSLLVGNKHSSGFEADLGNLLEFDQISLHELPPPVLKRLRIEASGDHRRYTLLTENETVFDLPDEGLSRMTVNVPKGAYRYVRFVWDDRETPKLPLPESVTVRLSREEQRPEPTQAAVPFEVSASRKDVTQYRVQLPAKELPVDAFVLETDQPQLLRRARVTEARGTSDGLHSYELGTATLRRAQRSGLVAANLRIPVQRPETSTLLLSIENGNNPPLIVKRVYVELAPQPFVYFEARQAGPHTAYFGAKALGAPNYDLAAEFDHARRLQTIEATWAGPAVANSGSRAPSTLTLHNASLMHGSVIDPRFFRFSRNIVAPKDSVARLPLDTAVLAHSQTLADVRILTADHRQVPYVLEHEAEPLVNALKLEALIATAKPKSFGAHASVYRVTLPYPNLPSGILALSTGSHVFQRQVSLHARRPQRPGKPVETEEIASANWVDLGTGVEAPSLELAVAAGTDPNLLLVIEDGDNVPLTALSCQLKLPGRSLRFYHTGSEPLNLYYGASELGPPSYDWALLTQEVEQLPFVDAHLGSENALASNHAKTSQHAKWFWGILVLTALSLVTLIVRLLRRTP